MIPQIVPTRVLLRMARFHVTSPYVVRWRTIEVAVMTHLAARHGVDLQQYVDLDIGCGNGVLGHALIRNVGIGFDVQRDSVAWTRQHKPAYRTVLCASATAMPLADQSQRVIFSNSVIEHIPDDQAVFDEIARVLAPGGLLIMSTVSEQFPQLTLGPQHTPAERAALDRSYAHVHYYSPTSLRAIFAQRGMDLLESVSYLDEQQAHQSHALRSWEQRQRRAGVWRRVNQLRRAPRGIASLATLRPLSVPDGQGVGLAVVARKSA